MRCLNKCSEFDDNLLVLFIFGRLSDSNKISFKTDDVLENLKDGKSLFEHGDLSSLNTLHARGNSHAINLLGLSCLWIVFSFIY